jgi:hypothetical protein
MRIRSEKIAAAERALESDSEDDNDPEVKARQLAARLERSGAKYSVRIQMVRQATLAMQAQRHVHSAAHAYTQACLRSCALQFLASPPLCVYG